ncbi:hypothetical protein AA0113_g8383 [Alternaria arborescens]|nr:hypothetical protein AA0113_g8383 [Alternaria arborescens]
MTHMARGSIPSFSGTPSAAAPTPSTATTTTDPHHHHHHHALVSRGLISYSKSPSNPKSRKQSKAPAATRRALDLPPPTLNMASSSSSTPLLYACIAHNTTVLTEHTASASSNASSLVSLVLPRIAHDKSAHKTIDQSKFFIHCLVKSPSDFPNNQSTAGGLTFLVIAERDLGQRIPFGFLTNLEKKFFAEFEPGSTNFHDLPPYGCASFNGALKRMMVEQGGTQAGQQDALRTAQREIEGVREIMTENIERVLERGEHMSVLVDKTGRLGENARDFRVRSRTLKRRMWWKNVKLMVLLTLVVIFLIYLFVGFGCGLPGWGRCLGH